MNQHQIRAAIYTRISEDDGTALGVQRQEEDARNEAANRGWEVARVYVDNDVSATRTRMRPQFHRMITDVRAGLVDAVLIWDTDRLTRTPREAEDLIDLADTHGLQIISLGGYRDLSTPNGRRDFRNDVTNARYETEKMARRLRRRLQQKAEAGEPQGRPGYGFTRVPVLDDAGRPTRLRRDEADPEQAAVIREVANRLLAGHSLRSVVSDLNLRGIPAPEAEKWNSTMLRQVMKRPSLAGLRVYKGKVIGRTTGDAILDESMHDRLIALLTDPSRRTNRAGNDYKYLLSGLARCGREGCGGAVRAGVGRLVSRPDGTAHRQPPSYVCTECFKVRRKVADVDSVVNDQIITLLRTPEVIGMFEHGDADAAARAQADIAALDAKLELIADQWAEDVITAAQFTRLNTRLRDKRVAAEQERRAALPNAALTVLSTGDVAASWDDAPIEVRRAIVSELVEVTILPTGPRGRRPFDKASVSVVPRTIVAL
ncbi:recombinase family protein [Agromyces kandeliae]|uniref:Recombinase family protein n=1 Tax=Agromyces kandeliae TaxID=2666141 RepID=A0A6L5R5M8_9MICO|nr:recombinase family protein [Agromyces kandeliae]MRX45323.1 hypothetical protein [Agromyces kandeliae]